MSEMVMKGTFISVIYIGTTPSGKTSRFEVQSDRGSVIGWISWYGPWRKYVYQPSAGSVYEETCLREIARFLETEMKTYRTVLARGKP